MESSQKEINCKIKIKRVTPKEILMYACIKAVDV